MGGRRHRARPDSSIAACDDEACYGGICNSGQLDFVRRTGIRKMARYAAHLWALNPDLLHFLPENKASFLPYTVAQYDPHPEGKIASGPRLRIVHAPTNRRIVIGRVCRARRRAAG